MENCEGFVTSAKEAFPFVSFDGKYLFFMSTRVSRLNPSKIPDGPGNVYWVDAGIIQKYRYTFAVRQAVIPYDETETEVRITRTGVSPPDLRVRLSRTECLP